MGWLRHRDTPFSSVIHMNIIGVIDQFKPLNFIFWFMSTTTFGSAHVSNFPPLDACVGFKDLGQQS
jgi:hypothetical protein